jgi:hypothetical protein
MSTTSRTLSRRRRVLAGAVAALCISLSASGPALARPADAVVPKAAVHQSTRIGDTPADFGKHVVVPQPKAGDTPVDFPGASRAPQAQPAPPVQIVQPERTIVRDAQPALPVILGGLALLIALAGAAQMLAQRRTLLRTH